MNFSLEYNLWPRITLYDRMWYTVLTLTVFAFFWHIQNITGEPWHDLLSNIIMQLVSGACYQLPANIWYLDAEQGSHYWTDADLLFHSQPRHSVLDTRDGMGVGMVSLGGTADPLPLPISCTNNMPHVSWARPILYSDRSSPALKLLRSTGHSILPVVSNSLHYWLVEAWKNSAIAKGHFVHFVNNGINNFCSDKLLL